MIEETARVQSVHDGVIEVIAERQSGCGGCEQKSGCSTSVLSQFFAQRHINLSLSSVLDVKPGDRVILGVPEAALIQGTLLMYGLPILMLIFGAMLGRVLSVWWSIGGEWLSIGVGLSGMFLSFYTLMHSDLGQRLIRLRPVLLRKA